MQRAPATLPPWLQEFLRRPALLIPAAVVGALLLLAVAIQPGGAAPSAASDDVAPVLTRTTPAASPTAVASPSSAATKPPAAASASSTPVNAVAGARSTPATTPAAGAPSQEELNQAATNCGTIQEVSVDAAVEQTLASVGVRATRATVYPMEYFRCILLATGGKEAITLATAISRAEANGQTHAVLIDLWVTNSTRDFAQVSVRGSTLSANGQTYAPIATLNGRAEAVVASGQGRAMTVVAAVKAAPGGTTGPMTLTIEAPLLGGKQQAGKYQLVLPLP